MSQKSPFEVEIKVGTIKKAEEFSEAKKPKMCKLWIDLGDEEVQSAAQLLYHHRPKNLEGKQVLCAVNLGSITIAGFRSEVLTLGVPGRDGNAVLVVPEKEVPDGGILR